MRRNGLRPSLIAVLLISISACSIYRLDTRQGNALEDDKIEQLKPGMSQVAVRDLMGTPLVRDAFRNDRWDYVFYYRDAKGKETLRRVSVFFDGDQVSRIERPETVTSTDGSLDKRLGAVPSGGAPVVTEPVEAGGLLRTETRLSNAPPSNPPAVEVATPAATPVPTPVFEQPVSPSGIDSAQPADVISLGFGAPPAAEPAQAAPTPARAPARILPAPAANQGLDKSDLEQKLRFHQSQISYHQAQIDDGHPRIDYHRQQLIKHKKDMLDVLEQLDARR